MKFGCSILFAFTLFCIMTSPARSQFSQQENKVLGIDTVGNGQKKYSITEIGIMTPTRINDKGQVSGSRVIGANTVALRWEKGSFKDFPYLEGTSVATGINKLGDMSGFIYGLSVTRAVIFRNDSIVILPDPNNVYSTTVAINDLGHVAGQVKFCDTCRNAAVWKGGNPIDLGSFSRYGSYAKDLNNFGLVVGDGEKPPSFQDHAFKTTGGGLVDLGSLGGEGTYAKAVNNLGHIAGSSTDALGKSHAVIWNPGILSIQTPGTFNGSANDINDSDVVVGDFADSAFVWKNGVMTNLNTLSDTAGGWVIKTAVAINNHGQIVGMGLHNGQLRAYLLDPSSLTISRPRAGERWIAGEQDTIRWTGGRAGQLLNIELSVNNGITYTQIDFGIPADLGFYIWDLPNDLLTTKARIKISIDTLSAVSDSFKIKPYVLTRIDENGDYYEYRKDRDQWGFSNITADIFPVPWYNQFDYSKTDPFTGSQYSPWQADHAFDFSQKYYFPDWVSWVNTFTIDECYHSTILGVYNESSVLAWRAINPRMTWKGSCFGIAVSNALAFSHREEFKTKYNIFPEFINPASVVSDSSVKRLVNELYTHQFGAAHLNYRKNIGLNKTPTQTLNELKVMFSQDTSQIRTLSFLNNGPGGGGHAIIAYGMEKDAVSDDIYHIIVYDNSNPTSNNRITINTAANDGNGSWINPDWPGWGGDKWIYLRNPTIEYLINPKIDPSLSANSILGIVENELQIFNRNSSVKITDGLGNSTGFYGNLIHSSIPGSVPLVADDATVSPPYGYALPDKDYSVTLNQFTSDSIETFFFAKDKIFSYARGGAVVGQTDKVSFNGGISVANTDIQTKKIKLLSLIDDSSQEKMFIIKSLQLSQGDSVRIEHTEDSTFRIISYGTTKEYDIEVNLAGAQGTDRFNDFKISLSENSTHIVKPDWTKLGSSNLVILVDEGNNGTIEDTIKLENKVTGVGIEQKKISLPDQYYLGQNYPNPFNPTTTIQYQLPAMNYVSLKVYDAIGREVSVLVNEMKGAGYYSVTFDASKLSTGVYIYTLRAGSFAASKKLLILR